MLFKSRDLHDLNLAAIMERWPQTLPVFVRHNLMCLGCTIAPFHTISDACHEHGLNENMILVELAIAINSRQ